MNLLHFSEARGCSGDPTAGSHQLDYREGYPRAYQKSLWATSKEFIQEAGGASGLAREARISCKSRFIPTNGVDQSPRSCSTLSLHERDRLARVRHGRDQILGASARSL